MLRVIGRLFVVALACLLALVATLFVLVTLGLERATKAIHDANGEFVGRIEWATFGMSVADWLFTVPGMVVIACLTLVAVGEIVRIRSILYYVAGGGLILAGAALMLRGGPTLEQGALLASAAWQVAATAGFAGGLVYWLVAGRRA